MAYTGNWLRSQQQADPRATHLAGPDPAHGQDASDPYPDDHQAPVPADYDGTDFMQTVVQTPGLVLEQDTRGHGSRGAYGTYRSQAERQAAQGRGHEGQDLGWARATYVEPPFQDDTTRYLEETWTGNGSAAPPPEAIQRGINSLPQNNPDVEGYDPGGFRRGLRSFRFVDRKRNINPRVYTAQQLLARDIRVPYNQPAQNTSFPRTSPFASMARVQDTIAQVPALFRSPQSLTDSILADQAAPADDSPIAVDGMWAVE